MRGLLGVVVMSVLSLGSVPATAQDLTAFGPGPVFADLGWVAPIPDADFAIPEGIDLHIAFDTSAPAEDGKINRTLDSAARFLNMHAAAGIEPARLRAAVVVHGKAGFDLLSDAGWAAKGREGTNPTAAAIPALIDNGVRVILCGQTAAAYAIRQEDLAPGVELALSAMTAHAVLQRQGYTLNPF